MSTFTTTLANATINAAQSTPTSTLQHPGQPVSTDNQETINILFGSLGAVLALMAIFIGYLQLRQFRERMIADHNSGRSEQV